MKMLIKNMISNPIGFVIDILTLIAGSLIGLVGYVFIVSIEYLFPDDKSVSP